VPVLTHPLRTNARSGNGGTAGRSSTGEARTQTIRRRGDPIQLVPLPLFHIFFCQVLWTARLSRNIVLTKSPIYSRTGAASIGAWLERRKTISWLIHPSPKQLMGAGKIKI
jgi:hypothetical protein